MLFLFPKMGLRSASQNDSLFHFKMYLQINDHAQTNHNQKKQNLTNLNKTKSINKKIHRNNKTRKLKKQTIKEPKL